MVLQLGIILRKKTGLQKLLKTTRPEKHNRLNVGRIDLERQVGALINCSLPQSGGGGGLGSLNGTKKF